jgi:hypothetical protein
MGFFSGPSSSILNKMAMGYVSALIEHGLILAMDISPEEKAELLKKSGLPNHRDELTTQVAVSVSRLGIGWLKRNQFLGMIQGNALAIGFSQADARYLKESVEMAFLAYQHATRRS